MLIQIAVPLCLFCVVCSYPISLSDRVRRHSADFKIAQYRACASYTGSYHDCGNVGWGLVDILRSGRKRQAQSPPFKLVLEEEDSNNKMDEDNIISFI